MVEPMRAQRYGVYFAPACDSDLWRRAALWLGRDAVSPLLLPPMPVAGLGPERTAHMVSAIRYGFHATIKAPMALKAGVDLKDLEKAVSRLAKILSPVNLGPLRVADLDGFLALVPSVEGVALSHLAASVVIGLDLLRAPLTDADRQRRLAGGPLDARGLELLDLWGYPHVLERFRFHMTLTDRLPPAVQVSLQSAAESWFAGLGDSALDRLVIFAEPEPGAPFIRGPEYRLVGGAK